MATNVINNGDFNSGQSGWSFSAIEGSGVATENETVTNHFCSISPTQSIWQSIALRAGSIVTLSIDAKNHSGTVAVMTLNTNDIHWEGALIGGVGQWHENLFTINVGEWAVGTLLMLHIQSGFSGEIPLDVDNIIMLNAD